MKKNILVTIACILSIFLALIFVPLNLPFASKIIESKIENKLHGDARFKSSSIVALKKIYIDCLVFTPNKKGVAFSCDKVTIDHDILLELVGTKSGRSDILIKNFYIDNNEKSVLSGLSGILLSDNKEKLPLFKEVKINSFKSDKDTVKNAISANGDKLRLQGSGTETNNGNVINYNLKITLQEDYAKRFKQFFYIPETQDGKELEISMAIQGQPNSPNIVISCEQFKINFRVNKFNE